MYKNMLSLFSAMVMALCSSYASSSTVSLNPAMLTVGPNQTFTVDLVLNFDPDPAADGQFSPATGNSYAGDVIMNYDSNALAFNGFTADPAQPSGLVITGLSSGTGVYSLRFSQAEFASSTGGNIGSYSFTSKNFTGNTQLMIDDANPSGSFVATVSGTLMSFNPSDPFGGATISAVPVPAAAWLMFSGLGLLGYVSRRSS